MFNTRRRFCAGLGALALGLPGRAPAQSLPTTLRMIVPVPAGATMDAVTRLIADRIKASLNRTVIVEYKAGAFGIVAAEYLATTAADGSNLLMLPVSVASVSPLLDSQFRFDVGRDVAPVCEVVGAPYTLAISNGLGATSLKEYIDAVRRDSKLGSVGFAGSRAGELVVLLMARAMQLELVPVSYKGGQLILNDMLGNHAPAGISIISDHLAMHRAGRLRILAVTGAKRTDLAPDIPTFTELGYPDVVVRSTLGFFARGGTPRGIVAQYATAINEALAIPEVRERLQVLGVEPTGGSPEDFKKLIFSERERWEPLARKARARIK